MSGISISDTVLNTKGKTNFSILISKKIIYFLILFSINYIFYFTDLSTPYILISLFLFIVLMILSSNMTVDGIIELWLWLMVLYPKRNIGIEHSESFIESYLLETNTVNFSFFLTVVVPMYIASYLIVALRNNRTISHIFLLIFLFIFQLLLLDFFKNNIKNDYLITTIFISLQFLIVIIINDNLISLSKLKSVFYKLIILLNSIFFVELILVFLNIIGPTNSLDFREGYRSIYIGFATEVGFWSMLGTFVALQKIFIDKKLKYLLFLIITIFIQFTTFDRGNLYLSFFLILIYLFFYRKDIFIIFSAFFALFSTYFFNLLLSSKLFKIKMILDSTKGIYADGLFEILGLNSLIYRLDVQTRYLDRILDNILLPSGFFTNSIRKNSNFSFFFDVDNFSKYYIDFDSETQESHSLFIQLFFELGLIIFLILIFYSIYRLRKFIMPFESKIIFLILVLFFSFQSLPRYSFIFVTIYGVFLLSKKSNSLINK